MVPSAVIPALQDHDAIAVDEVHKPVLFGNSARPGSLFSWSWGCSPVFAAVHLWRHSCRSGAVFRRLRPLTNICG